MPQQREAAHAQGEIVDAVFAITCRSLPLDHAWALSQAIQAVLPWFAGEPGTALHTIHGAASGAGWMRPEGEDAVLQVSRRAKLALRLPRRRFDDAAAMLGQTLQVGGWPLRVDSVALRPLARITTLFSRCVVFEGAEDEAGFLAAGKRELETLDINAERMLCGRVTPVATPGRIHRSRSLMLAGMTPAHSLALQRAGLGTGRTLGCGVFIPHKDIADLRTRTD